jgi:choline monooxygenase
MNTSRINPIDHQRTELFYHFYFADPERETEIEDTIARNLAVVREDFEICIETHKNYASNAYSAGPLSPRHEAGVAYFQNRLKQSLGIS